MNLNNDRLWRYERVIHQGARAFVEVGRALAAIRDERLYAVRFKSFDSYCRDRWGMSRALADRLIAAADVVGDIEAARRSADNCQQLPPVESEAVARELVKLPAARRVRAWAMATKTTSRPTAHQVRVVVARLRHLGPARLKARGRVASDLHELAACGRRFGTIYVDPPWHFENQSGQGTTGEHYAAMPTDEICSLPVAKLAADRSHLHLWTPNALIEDGLRVMAAWGFAYKALFTWVKPGMGLGNYWRNSTELLLLGVRGSLPFADKSLVNWGDFPRGRHSEKPDEVRSLIERASPGPRLELFARKQSKGWTAWGDEVPRLAASAVA